ncbi:unnamed protein product [Symbiodinium natans]|uniref:Reverse transcriptase Ty1/copia-type domain-containing protein n=1 Tax=Symbiodinium natans TaxID=878477 RepID=A0A812LEY5_9DINO|nr:unnamed protein product [Symbiodinium natans]
MEPRACLTAQQWIAGRARCYQLFTLNVRSGALSVSPAPNLTDMFDSLQEDRHRASIVVNCTIWGHFEWQTGLTVTPVTGAIQIQVEDDTCWKQVMTPHVWWLHMQVEGRYASHGSCRAACRKAPACGVYNFDSNWGGACYFLAACGSPHVSGCRWAEGAYEKIGNCSVGSTCLNLSASQPVWFLGTLGTIGSTFAADSPAATHLAQLGIASPDFAGDADFQEEVEKGEMATPEQLVQEIAALRQELARQAQQHQQDLEQVRTESQQRTNEATQAALAAQGQLGTIPNVVREMGQTLQNALRERDKELVEAMRSSSSDKGKMVLVDTKGLGKPSMFSGDAEQYLPWRHRMTAYVCSIYPELREVLEWCEEREKSISSDELSEAFGEKADEIDRIPKLFDKSMELSSALQMVTAKEPFAIVINCNTNGFEAWRRLARRYDPATASRKRSMLKSVINPQKQKLEHLPQAIEEWLDAIASYEKRKDASGNRGKIPEEIKIAALESMLPQDLEAHVQLNQSKFAGFEDLLEEVTRYVEHRTGKTLKAFSTTQIAGKEALGDPMDVSSVGKGLGKHQQKTKKMPGFGDRLRNAGIDPEQLEGLNDDEAQELQDALLESLAALQARRAKARNTQPEEAAAQMLPRPKCTSESSTPKSGGRVPVPGSVRPAEPKGPPPVKTRGSRERGRSLERAPKSPRTSGKEPKKHEEERNREKASGSEDPKKHEEERNKEKASGSEETKGSRYKPKKKLTLRVMRELKSKEDWAKMNYSQRREHQERIRHLLPPGTVGQQILKKQGSACSTCRSRRRKTRKAVQEYLARKRKEYESLKKPPPVGLARSLLRREGMLKPPGERKGPSKKGPKEEKEASEESEGKSVEPPSSGQEEWSEEEEPKESDETVEVNEEEEEQGPPGRRKPTSHSGVSPAGGFELEVEELQPERRPKEPSEKDKARAREEHAARMRALQGQQLAPAEAKPKAEAKAIAKASDATANATSMSSSAAMQNMLQGSLLGSLTQDRGRLLKRLEEFKKEEMSEDDFEEKSQIEAELESILEQIAKLKERGLARPAPKAAERLDQSVHDARYRAAIAKGMSHAKAWKEEKGRRRAAQQRQQGEKHRATLNVEMQEAWAKHFSTVPGRKEDKVQVDAVETVTVDSSGKEIDPSTVRSSVAVPLTRKERTYYRQEYEEELKPRKEKVEKPPDPERRRRKPPRDPDEPRDPPEGEALVASVETTMATNAVSASGGRGSQRGQERVEVNFDSGAAVTVVPLKFGNGNEKPREEMKFKTASGENIADHGPIKLKGTTSTGNNATLHGRLADVHRVLGSASDICRTHHAVLGDNGGYLIPKQNAFGKEFNMMMRKLVRKYRDDPRSATRLHVSPSDLEAPPVGENQGPGEVPTLHADYFFLGSDGEREDIMPHLVVRCDRTRRTWATSLPQKGVHPFNTNWFCSIVREAGWKRMILFSDGEPALVALKQAVVENMRDVEITLKESPTSVNEENAPSNGYAECAVREVKRMIRATLSDLESKLQLKIDPNHSILPWIARHAAFLLTRFRTGDDGKSAYQRAVGREWRRPTVVFGEQILFKPVGALGKKRSSPLEPRVAMGRYVGTASRNADLLVMTPTGVVKGHSLHRRAEEDRWSKEGFDQLRGLPWKWTNPVERAPPNRVDMPELVGEQPKPDPKEFRARSLYVLKSDLAKYGYTTLCPGCEAQMLDLPQRSHNEECRFRIQRHLMETEEGKQRVQRAIERMDKDYSAKNKKKRKAQEEPALEGQPAEGEVAAEEAAGAPLERPSQMQVDNPSRGSRKREAERHVEDLYHEEQETDEPEIVRANIQGGSSGSGGEHTDLSYKQVKDPEQLDDVSYLEHEFHSRGMRCTRKEAEVISNLVGSLGVDVKASVPLNEGLCLSVEDKGWRLQKQDEVEALFRKLEEEKPTLVVGLPPDGPFAGVQRSYNSLQKVSKEKEKSVLEVGRKQVRTCVEAYKFQLGQQKYYLQECPKGAKSWEHTQYQQLSEESYVVEGPICRWTVNKSGGNLEGSSFKKRTRWITNSAALAAALRKTCARTGQERVWKRELAFEEGKVAARLCYPPKLVQAIAKGIKAQLVLDGELKELGSVGGPDPHEEPNFEEHHYETLPKADELYVKEPVIDANTGAELDPKKVAKARLTELEWVKKQNVYTKVDEATCWQETGRPPITLKWVDRNKGDNVNENYRSRLVVREVKSQGQAALLPEHALFSSMPPLEAVKLLCSLMTTLRVSRRGGKLSLRLIDISRAHFYGRATRRIFVTLPEGDESPGKCGLLLKTMYGTRDASSTWQRDYSELMAKHDFRAGKAWPCIFYNEKEDVRLLVHGDDFFCLADDEGHAYLDKALSERYEYRCDGHIGPTHGDQMVVLNRLICYDKETGKVTYEADPRHVEALVRELGLEKAKAVRTPAEKKKQGEVMKTLEMPPMNDAMQRSYRSITMRAAFLAQDRPDIAEATKSLARHMKAPHEAAWSDLKRLGRYLSGKPRLVYEYHPQRFQKDLTVYCDSDHAGCLIARRSTTGIVTMYGSHCIKHSSNVQTTVSLSSGESEFYAIVKASAVGLSQQALLHDWGIQVNLRILSDSIATEKNLSDLCTKPLPEIAVEKHLKTMGLKHYEKRAEGGKQLV